MRCFYLIALASVLAMPTVSTLADEPTADQRLGATRSLFETDDTSVIPGLFTENGLALFRLVSGRIEVDPARYRKGSDSITHSRFTESIQVSCSEGVPAIRYRFQNSNQRIELIARGGGALRIGSTLLATGETAVLFQPARGDIRFSTRRNPETESKLDQSVSGSTLLHIIGLDSAGYEIHLESLLTRMLRGRSLLQVARRTEAHLRQHSDGLKPIPSQQISQLVYKLGSAKASDRRLAQFKLAELGSVAIPLLLEALKRGSLDAEQRTRIESLVARTRRLDEDTPASLACRLSTDRAHWQIMASRMRSSELIAANRHLRRCGLPEIRR